MSRHIFAERFGCLAQRCLVIKWPFSSIDSKTIMLDLNFAASFIYLYARKKNEKKRSDSCETLFWHTRCVHMCIVDLSHMVVKQQNRLQNVKWHKIDLYRTSHFNSSWAYAAASNATSCLCTVLLLFIKFFFVRCCCFCAKLVIVILI